MAFPNVARGRSPPIRDSPGGSIARCEESGGGVVLELDHNGDVFGENRGHLCFNNQEHRLWQVSKFERKEWAESVSE